MRKALRLALAALVLVAAATDAMAQAKGGAKPQRAQAARPPAGNSYGLPDCSQRPFARECDRRGTW